MSLSSLKKSTQSVKPHLVTVDEFINEAVDYANGVQHQGSANSKLLKVVSRNHQPVQEKMKRATYTLDEATISSLTEISERTGIPRSRLIRILVRKLLVKLSDKELLNSTVR